VLVKSDLVDQTMEYFYEVFDKIELLYEKDDPIDIEDNLIPFKRKILYTYKESLQLDNIIEFADNNRIPFANFSILNGPEQKKFKLLCNEEKKVILDITSVVTSSIKEHELIYLVEQALEPFPYYDAIIRENIADDTLDLYRSLFSSKKPVNELLKEISLDEVEKLPEKQLKKVIDLKSPEIICENLYSELIGHDNFKMNLKENIKNFIVLNKIGAEKIFSIFLLGDSGLGKTEVARIIKRTLNDDTPLVQINFGNYSSQDALNSLIGSPRGYKGSEEGELSLKINKSKAGIILCDEFEKSTSSLFNFFLELLENGVFTDSQSQEHDLDGYIIVFTSNINEQQFYKDIPNELQSRLDIVCEFKALTREKKIEYVEYQIKKFLEKLKAKNYLKDFSEQDVEDFKSEINIDSTDDLRDIKRMINRKILNKILK
ncbi:MAG: AAA family ATPase, partial [Methanobacterium paludis]|nr:AAA family ATPase [Methanobacterium paludis]